MEEVFELLVPELPRRGLFHFHTEYEAATLRENPGLANPVHPATK
jgi:hypothetical protein